MKHQGFLSTSDKPHYENEPFEVPSSWVWTTLGDIAEIITGNTPSKDIKEYYSGNIPFFKPTDLEQGIHTKYSKDRLTPLGFEQSRKLPANSVLVTCIGATIGKTGLTTVEGTCNQQINAIIPTSAILAKFLFYVCISDYMQHEIKANASATTLPILNKANFSKIAITIPPLQEQSRIVKSIEHWLSLVDCIERNKENLQRTIRECKSKILTLAIHGKLVPQDPTDEPACELLKRINPKTEITSDNGHYQKLPEGWVITPMQTLCALVDGEKQNGIERINLDVKYLRGEREAKVLTSGKYTAANTLLILVDGENSGEVFRAPVDGYQGSTFKQLSIHEVMYTDYVLQVINLHRKTLRENKVGSAIPHLNKKLFKAINVPIPPYEEQKRIVNAINKTFTILDTIAENL